MAFFGVRPFLIAFLALLVFAAPSAHAYKLSGDKWPTRTITYNASKAPKFKEAIKRAVRAWNTSGVRVRFRATSRARARLRIFESRGYGSLGGYASLGWESPSTITIRTLGGVPLEGGPIPCGTRVQGRGRVICQRGPSVLLHDAPKDRTNPFWAKSMEVVVAHELGHVLGLNHVRSKCALMHPNANQGCKAILEPWRLRCRLIESDDLRGAIRRYGGRMRPLAPEFCDVTPEPAAPTEMTATFDAAERVVNVGWTNPASAGIVSADVVLRPGGCPPSFEGAYSYEAKPGERNTAQLYPEETASGLHCVAVRSKDGYQHPSQPAMAEVQVEPSSVPPF